MWARGLGGRGLKARREGGPIEEREPAFTSQQSNRRSSVRERREDRSCIREKGKAGIRKNEINVGRLTRSPTLGMDKKERFHKVAFSRKVQYCRIALLWYKGTEFKTNLLSPVSGVCSTLVDKSHRTFLSCAWVFRSFFPR